ARHPPCEVLRTLRVLARELHAARRVAGLELRADGLLRGVRARAPADLRGLGAAGDEQLRVSTRRGPEGRPPVLRNHAAEVVLDLLESQRPAEALEQSAHRPGGLGLGLGRERLRVFDL